MHLIVLPPEEDDGGAAWIRGLSEEWADDLQDAQQDIYTLGDGQPVGIAAP